MFTVRRDQFAALEDAQRHQFALEMVEHLRSFAPVHAQKLGDALLYRLVRDALPRAAAYGFTLRGPVRLFIELLLLLGTYFDTDPQYPWAAIALKDHSMSDQMVRADLLQEQVTDFYESAIGANGQHEHAAIRRLRENAFEGLSERLDELPGELLHRLRIVYPEKVKFVGDIALGALLTEATELARDHGLVTASGTALFFAVAFALGHRADIDPQFPWVARVLAEAEPPGSTRRFTNLRNQFLAFMRQGAPAKGD